MSSSGRFAFELPFSNFFPVFLLFVAIFFLKILCVGLSPVSPALARNLAVGPLRDVEVLRGPLLVGDLAQAGP